MKQRHLSVRGLFSVLALAVAACVCLSSCSGTARLKAEANPDFQNGWSTTNNGYDKDSPEVQRLISVVPSDVQLAFSKLGYYSFIHFGMNTFTDVEWGTGKESPSQFDPETIDTDQWVEALQASGSKGIIFTAKHHDGFCLWPSAYTEHSVKNSPYQDGKGDVVRQLSDSCRKYGMKFGIYLSPWDMHESTYGTDAYNDYFVNQLTELCTNYGELFCIWFDGARGEGIPGDFYTFDRYYEVIRTLQPNCAISNVGPDVRWIGNEGGKVRDSEWSVVSDGTARAENQANSQTNVGQQEELQGIQHTASDLGSREVVAPYRDLRWHPAEADVSLTDGWFSSGRIKNGTKLTPNFHKNAKQLMKLYYNTVGGNASLLLNVPPTKEGVISEKDVKILREFGDRLRAAFASPLAVSKLSVGDADAMRTSDEAAVILTDDDNSYRLGDAEYILDLDLGAAQSVARVVLREDISQSQRVEAFDIYAKTGDGYAKAGSYTVIGSKKIVNFDKPIETDQLRIVIRQSRSNPVLSYIGLFA